MDARDRDPWGEGDYHGVVGRHLTPIAEMAVRESQAAPGTRVLDVGCGTGNAVLAAARTGAKAVGLDKSLSLIEIAQDTASMEHLRADFVLGDAQQLPHPDGSFDVAVSIFGHVFAADPGRATRELMRVVRPGGKVVYTAWRYDSASGDMVETVLHHMGKGADREKAVAAFQWADERHVKETLGDAVTEVTSTVREVQFPSRGAEDFVAEHISASPGMIAMMKPFRRDARKFMAVRRDLSAALSAHYRGGAMRFRYIMLQIEKA